MNLLQRIEQWGDRHHPRWMDIVRIALGGFLIYKAIDVLNNMSDMITLMEGNTNFGDFSYVLAVHYAVFAHLLGGVMLIFGVMTRFACLIQIPVLIGALFFLGTNREMLRPYSEIIISIVVLLLLLYFLVVGNGPWSVKVTDDGERRKQVRS
jgi:uncharacterized membrane protein YphA (DoxX/SURF4 family)